MRANGSCGYEIVSERPMNLHMHQILMPQALRKEVDDGAYRVCEGTRKEIHSEQMRCY